MQCFLIGAFSKHIINRFALRLRCQHSITAHPHNPNALVLYIKTIELKLKLSKCVFGTEFNLIDWLRFWCISKLMKKVMKLNRPVPAVTSKARPKTSYVSNAQVDSIEPSSSCDCLDKSDTFLICDGCDDEHALCCLGLDQAPYEDEWFCDTCKQMARLH